MEGRKEGKNKERQMERKNGGLLIWVTGSLRSLGATPSALVPEASGVGCLALTYELAGRAK